MTITATSDNQIRKSNIRNWTIGLQTFATGSLPRSGLVQRDLWNVAARYSGFAPDNFTTLPHFSVSSAMNLPNSAAVIGIGTPPRSSSRALIVGSARPALIASLSLSIICGGVFLGAPTPNQELAS